MIAEVSSPSFGLLLSALVDVPRAWHYSMPWWVGNCAGW